MLIGTLKTHNRTLAVSDTGIVWNEYGKRMKPVQGEGMTAYYSIFTGCPNVITKYPVEALIEAAFNHSHIIDPKYAVTERKKTKKIICKKVVF